MRSSSSLFQTVSLLLYHMSVLLGDSLLGVLDAVAQLEQRLSGLQLEGPGGG